MHPSPTPQPFVTPLPPSIPAQRTKVSHQMRPLSLQPSLRQQLLGHPLRGQKEGCQGEQRGQHHAVPYCPQPLCSPPTPGTTPGTPATPGTPGTPGTPATPGTPGTPPMPGTPTPGTPTPAPAGSEKREFGVAEPWDKEGGLPLPSCHGEAPRASSLQAAGTRAWCWVTQEAGKSPAQGTMPWGAPDDPRHEEMEPFSPKGQRSGWWPPVATWKCWDLGRSSAIKSSLVCESRGQEDCQFSP